MLNVQKSGNGTSGCGSATGHGPKSKRTIWIWAQRLLLASGLALLAFYGLARIESFLGSRRAIEKFDALESSAAVTSDNGEEDVPSSPELGTPEVDFRLWGKRRIQAYKESLTKPSDAPMGVLRISKINLEVPIFDGTDDLTLNHAVGRIRGTARPGEQGNIGIAGHRDGFFRGLKDVDAGDSIELRTLTGTDTYIVDQIKIVTPNDVDVLKPRSVPSLTLVTCYPFYFIGSAPQRYIITAFLSNERKSGPGKSESPAAISNMQFNEEKQ